MDADELYHRVRERPFDPFRIYVSDGMAYHVKHPEQIMIGRRSSHVGLGDGEGPFQRIAVVANIHIARIEPLESSKRKRASKPEQ
ncbi:MAG: hypothetical protein JSU86_09370 [Phycisphaerales bacterium]|nr:MAG: hypothetical protein JSU86_09370 [Phycisphaerales bacterium]